jgi:endoglucanase
MRMKSLLFTLLSLFLTFSGSCSCKGNENPADAETVPLAVSPTALSFAASTGSQSLTVTGTSKPAVVSDANWCRARTGNFTAHRTEVTVTVEENVGSHSRTATLSVVCDGEKVKVDISQAGAVENPDLPVPGNNAAWKIARKLGLGWNLGNQMDAHSNGVAGETVWGNPVATRETFQGLKKKGFTSVRIPVTWLGHIGAAPEYSLDAVWLERVAELVGWAREVGLTVIINIHHDGADSAHWLDIKSAAKDPARQAAIVTEIKAVWGQIAERFKQADDGLIFEAFNEIHDGGWGWGENRTDGGAQYRCLNAWNQAFVDAVRATGGQNATRYLGIPGYCTNPDLTIGHLTLPEDSATDRLLISVHCYDPSDYTLFAKFSEWGHTGAAGRVPDSGEAAIRSTFAKLHAAYVDKGIPCYLGETGCVNRSTAREKLFQRYYLEYVFKAAKTYGLAPFLWDNGSERTGYECHGFIHHGTGDYIGDSKAVIDALVKALFTQDSSYTLETVYQHAP